MPTSFWKIIGSLAAVLTFYGFFWAATISCLLRLNLNSEQGAVRWSLLASGGVLLPTVIVLTIAIACLLRRRHVADDELVIHLLDICYLDLAVVALEVRRERGPGFKKARQVTHDILSLYLRLCRSHFDRDRNLLRRLDPADHSGAQREFIATKQKVIEICENAHTQLSGDLDNEASQFAIKNAGDSLKKAVDLLENKRDLLSRQVS